MANGPGRGPKSNSLADIYVWCVAHDVDIESRWHQIWKDLKALLLHVDKLEERVDTLESFRDNLKGQIGAWAALGAVIGSGFAALVAFFLK